MFIVLKKSTRLRRHYSHSAKEGNTLATTFRIVKTDVTGISFKMIHIKLPGSKIKIRKTEKRYMFFLEG